MQHSLYDNQVASIEDGDASVPCIGVPWPDSPLSAWAARLAEKASVGQYLDGLTERRHPVASIEDNNIEKLIGCKNTE